MTDHSIYLSALQQMQSTQDFSALEKQWGEPMQWEKMTKDERWLLACLFIEGAKELAPDQAIVRLEIASSIIPNSVNILHKQALVLFEMGRNAKDSTLLHAAEKKCIEALKLDSEISYIWKTYIEKLLALAELSEDDTYFRQIEFVLNKAENTFIYSSTMQIIFWGLQGSLHFVRAKQAQEPIDYAIALQWYDRIELMQIDDYDILNSYAQCVLELYRLIGNPVYLTKSIDIIHRIVQIRPTHIEAWYSLGSSLSLRYYKLGGQADLFAADAAFAQCCKLQTAQFNIHLSWAKLLLEAARNQQDFIRLQQCLNQIQLASQCMPCNHQLMALYIEASSLAGALADDLSYLKEARSKADAVLEIYPYESSLWYSSGLCLTEWGHYFYDEDFYVQAAEHLRQGLKFQPDDAFLWNALGKVNFSLGMLLQDSYYIEQASVLYKKATMLQQDNAHFRVDWGIALLKIGEYLGEQTYFEKAIDTFEYAIGLQGNTPESCDIECLYHYGCAWDFLGDFQEESKYYDQAVHILSQVLQRQPRHMRACYNLALALFHRGELDTEIEDLHASLSLFRKLVEEDPEDDIIWHDWGVALLHLAVLVDDPSQEEEFHRIMHDAESKLLQAAALGNIYVFYQLTCLYAIKQQYDQSISWLTLAEQYGALPPIDDLMQDQWLEDLRETELFRAFIEQLNIGND